jgi:hypothetical protein
MPLILLRGIHSVHSYISMATAQMIGVEALVLVAIRTEIMKSTTFVTAVLHERDSDTEIFLIDGGY